MSEQGEFSRPSVEDERRALLWLVDVWTHGGPLERRYAASVIKTLAWFEDQPVSSTAGGASSAGHDRRRMTAVTDSFARAQGRAAGRLVDARGSIREAFNSLDCGVTFDDLIVYIERDSHAKALQGVADDLDRLHARMVGLVAGAATMIVESDRLRRVSA